jgi:hypothetical protein
MNAQFEECQTPGTTPQSLADAEVETAEETVEE